MGLLADADVKLLSDKWRETVLIGILTICVTVLGAISFWILKDLQIIIVTLGILFAVNRKAIGFDIDNLKQILQGMKKTNVNDVKK
jgi:hypothetical protein